MKLLNKALLVAVSTALVACGNLSKVESDGSIKDGNVVWPNPSDSTFNHDGSQFGSWVNVKSLNQIETGMNKDQVRELIGRPHFSEGLYGVSEWDYVFNYRDSDQVKQCQVKFVFDRHHNLGKTFRKPEGCLE